ncbi:hypothetical protein B4U80_14935 [Leptotrombidium deliense]|uniref:Peptidase S1 domain-containing protein n=1 Tax=Leptotrombidium deliense TaxID=299467 RepID=A0A443RZB9_9ACAR|nr:hypothetical protein B4U80_14935 [Leptotrombidium deliense]
MMQRFAQEVVEALTIVDSGGVLFQSIGNNFFAAGIVSFGFLCYTSKSNGYITNVSHFVPWIEKHTTISSFNLLKEKMKAGGVPGLISPPLSIQNPETL